MDEIINIYGENAGKIWRILNAHGPLTKHQILHQINLSDKEFYTAVGWLAREDKIRKDGEFYSLADKTNLIEKIGVDAGKIVTILKNLKNDISEIAHLTTMDEKDVYAALGWLAREGKIEEINQEIPKIPERVEEKIHLLQQETLELNDEVNSRDQIIYELTQQLTEMQTQSILQADIIEHLSVGKPMDLASEMQSLQEELQLRNKIIHELTQQLTETQRQKIEHMVTEHIRTNILRNLSNLQIDDIPLDSSSEVMNSALLDNPVLHLQKDISSISNPSSFHPFEESFEEHIHPKKPTVADK